MAIRESQRKAVAKYNAANYDRIELKVPKGQKQILAEYAAGNGESLNAFAYRAMREAMAAGEPIQMKDNTTIEE